LGGSGFFSSFLPPLASAPFLGSSFLAAPASAAGVAVAAPDPAPPPIDPANLGRPSAINYVTNMIILVQLFFLYSFQQLF